MIAHMTNGTADFLKKLADKYPNKQIWLMHSDTSSLAYYEDNKKSIFVSGRDYDILLKNGEIQEEGYVVMNNIPVTEEGQPVFEDRFRKRKQDVENMPGFQALRLLKPKKGNTYIVFTQWQRVKDYENWKNSDQFKQSHKNQSAKPPAYFAERPFLSTYQMFVDEE
ncbi:antibiotic biosynthesis monooxygenase family protein [Cerasibacillus sp. JNUCC 74]